MNSFERIQDWKDELHRIAGDIPFIVLGNKSDLESQRQTGKRSGEDLCSEVSAVTFFETSAKTGEIFLLFYIF